MSGATAMNAQCPECDSWIPVPGSAEIWDTLVCPRCHTELQLINDRPPELDFADYDDMYDDEDYEEDYDEVFEVGEAYDDDESGDY
jgi:uncharacterized protein YbaR (Trm112 family)